MSTRTAGQVLESVFDQLHQSSEGATIPSLLGNAKAARHGDCFTIRVPLQFSLDYLAQQERLRTVVALIKKASGCSKVEFKVDASLEEKTDDRKKSAPAAAQQRLPFDQPTDPFENGTIIIHPGNKVACVVAEEIGRGMAPTLDYKALFLYGEVGSGKTSLLNAIVALRQRHYPSNQVKLIGVREFLRRFTASLRDKSTERFLAPYYKLQLLLIDDLQDVRGKETLSALLLIIDHILEGGGQIVAAGSQEPVEILKRATSIPERVRAALISRLSSGVTIQIRLPNAEARLGILQQMVRSGEQKIIISSEALTYLATHTTGDIRYLKGSLLTAVAIVRAQGLGTVTEAIAQEAVNGPSGPGGKHITPECVMAIVASHFNSSGCPITSTILKSRRKTDLVAWARQVAMALCLELIPDIDYPNVGKAFARNRATVRYAEKRVGERCSASAFLEQQVSALRETILQEASKRRR